MAFDLYGSQSKSIPQKIIIHFFELLFLGLAYWILFLNGSQWFSEHIHVADAENALNRRIIIFACHIIIFLRIGFAMIFLIKRKIPWEESVSVPMAFAMYYIGYSLLVLPTEKEIDLIDYIAIMVFLCGCFFNTTSEILRDRWKKHPENKGKLYTKGLFKYSRHINYFGDLLWVTGYAILTRNWFSVLIPVFLFCFFAFFNAPKLDKYLKEKYGEAYNEYERKTKMIIPFIF